MATKSWERKSRSAMVYIPFAALVVVFLVIFGVGVFLRILYFEIEGASRYTELEIIKASGIASGDSLIFLDADTAAKYIISELPYIADVKISHTLPDTLCIEVKEIAAFAVIAYKDGYVILDSIGRELEKTQTMPEGLIELKGFVPYESSQGQIIKVSSADESKFIFALEVMAEIEDRNIHSNVSVLDASNITKITIQYSDKYRVVLGTTTDIKNKFGLLLAFVAERASSEAPDLTGTYNMSETTGSGIWSPDR